MNCCLGPLDDATITPGLGNSIPGMGGGQTYEKLPYLWLSGAETYKTILMYSCLMALPTFILWGAGEGANNLYFSLKAFTL